MFYRRHITLALAFSLIASLLLGGLLSTGASAQQQQDTTQDKNRPRRAGEQPTQQTPTQQSPPAPKPTPTKEEGVPLQDDEVVRVETDLTNILFTAVDKQKRFITTLKQEDIHVTEDGQPQEIFTFARQTDLPLSLAILIDTSISEERTLPVEKAAASSFVDAVIRPDKDEAAVVSFTGEATLEQNLTGNASRVRRALDRVEFVPPSGYIGNGQVAGTPPISGTNQSTQGSTAIWDAIWVTSDEILSGTSDKTRRAIILLTDGQDSSSHKKMDEAIDRALKSDAVIYAIGIGDEYYGGINKGTLRKLSERTGGRAFFPEDESELRAAFAQIQLELRSQYLVAYSSTNKSKDGSFRHVQIEITNPELRKQSYKLTYRQGYFARSATK
ncbi:MAG TPA: VWA domain-containing protein [Pyrinomonadaceae bacterium]|jgi:VWFA-related protein|nr:VWA domain-containing protein [Pyrinomonadaceae bacterium]